MKERASCKKKMETKRQNINRKWQEESKVIRWRSDPKRGRSKKLTRWRCFCFYGELINSKHSDFLLLYFRSLTLWESERVIVRRACYWREHWRCLSVFPSAFIEIWRAADGVSEGLSWVLSDCDSDVLSSERFPCVRIFDFWVMRARRTSLCLNYRLDNSDQDLISSFSIWTVKYVGHQNVDESEISFWNSFDFLRSVETDLRPCSDFVLFFFSWRREILSLTADAWDPENG